MGHVACKLAGLGSCRTLALSYACGLIAPLDGVRWLHTALLVRNRYRFCAPRLPLTAPWPGQSGDPVDGLGSLGAAGKLGDDEGTGDSGSDVDGGGMADAGLEHELDTLAANDAEADAEQADELFGVPEELDPEVVAARAAFGDAVDAVRLPRYDSETHRVFDADSGQYIGRITELHKGTKKHAISVYCARHQHSKIVKVAQCPPQHALLRWLQLGADCTAGKEGGREHMGLWSACVQEG